MLQIISVISLLLSIIASTIAIGENFKPSSLTKGLLIISLSSGFIIFSKVIFENFKDISSFFYILIGIMGLSATAFFILNYKVFRLEDAIEKNLHRHKIPLVIITLVPLLSWIINSITPKLPSLTPPNEYIFMLSQYKISDASFTYMAQNIPTTIFFCIKVFEMAVILTLSCKSMMYILRTEYYVRDEVPYSVERFMVSSLVTNTFILIFSSTNIFVFALEEVYQWF